jgi:intracellular septation protein
MQLILEFFPLAAFLIAYKLGGVYAATATLMVAMLLSVAISWLRTRTVSPMLGGSTVLVLVFGAATLVLRDIRFIQWKPSIMLWAVALAFLVSAFVGKQPLAQRFLQPTLGDIQLQRRDWMKVNSAWVLFGLLIGLANLYVAYNFSEATWVDVKVFGLPASMFVFLIAQVFWLHARGKAQQ